MTRIAALSVPTVTRPAAASPAAPAAAPAVQISDKAPGQAAKDLAPAAPLVAQDALAALIEAQASHGNGHTDPQPDHGNDDAHGHQPPPQPTPDPTPTPAPPPVVQPPVVKPPVVQPPVTPPPVVQPPAPHARPASDPAAPARVVAMIERTLADGRASEAARSAFAAAAAERRAATTVVQGQAALAILSAVQTDMAGYRAEALGRYETARRLA